MLTQYIQASMKHARFEWLPESQVYYGDIPELPGVWATGPDESRCRAALQEVLEDWISLMFRTGKLLPPVDGININVKMNGEEDPLQP